MPAEILGPYLMRFEGVVFNLVRDMALSNHDCHVLVVRSFDEERDCDITWGILVHNLNSGMIEVHTKDGRHRQDYARLTEALEALVTK